MWSVLILPIQRGCGREAQSRQPQSAGPPIYVMFSVVFECAHTDARAPMCGAVRRWLRRAVGVLAKGRWLRPPLAQSLKLGARGVAHGG